MNRSLRLCLAAFLTAQPGAWAQRDPHIGYIFPAGGRQGVSMDATIGGQYLNGPKGVYVSGGGVRATVVDYTKPLTQKEINELREKLRKLEEHLRPAGIKRSEGGEPAEVKRLAGELGLAAVDRKSIASFRKKLFDPKRQLNPQLAETVRLRIALAQDAVPGRRELRLMTAAGLSNPMYFDIGPWPEYSEREPNEEWPDSGILAELPGVLNGQILPGDVDRFRFTARAGSRLVVAARARDLIPYLADAVPGWFQATLALYDGRGCEVAYADDYRFHPDPVLSYEIPADGPYVLEIKDAIYRGREDFVYRVALGEMPFVTSIYPLGGRAGEETTVAVEGWNVPAAQVAKTAEGPGPAIEWIAACRDGLMSNSVPFAVDTLPECREDEPNDLLEKAQGVGSPRIINGRINGPGDLDVFRFEGRAGEDLCAEVMARRLGSPLDSLLTLAEASGRILAANDDHEDKGAGLTTHHADSYLRVTLPSDGSYFVGVRDTQHKGGDAYGYRLRISPPRPDFALRVVPSTINAGAGAIVPITVYALRKDGFAGDIALALKDPPPGFVLSGAWVPAGQSSIRLTLTMPAAPGEDPYALRLEGSAVIQDQAVARDAVPAEDMMQAFLYRHLVPVKDWMVAVTGRGRGRAGVKIRGEKPVKLKAGEATLVRINAPRGLFPNQVELELSESPEGITIDSVAIDRGGMAILLHAEGERVKAGLKGNLIINVFTERIIQPKGKGPAEKAEKRRVPLGSLPAIPFEILKL